MYQVVQAYESLEGTHGHTLRRTRCSAQAKRDAAQVRRMRQGVWQTESTGATSEGSYRFVKLCLSAAYLNFNPGIWISSAILVNDPT